MISSRDAQGGGKGGNGSGGDDENEKEGTCRDSGQEHAAANDLTGTQHPGQNGELKGHVL